MTLVAGLRLSSVAAPIVQGGPIDGEGFEAYVRHILRPDLRPGDIVVMDNLSSHKRPQVRALIEEAGSSLRRRDP